MGIIATARQYLISGGNERLGNLHQTPDHDHLGHGGAAFRRAIRLFLPCRWHELPNVDFPTIVVTGSLPGADAATMSSGVATPLEAQFSLIPGLDTMSSTSVLGSTQITLQFRLDRNIDAAAQDVQSALSAAARQLPPSMPTPPTMRKVNPAESSILQITVTSPTLPLSVVDEYAETIIVRSISTIDGVANVEIYGQAHPAVRIQVDPNALAARGIGIDQVASAVRSANVNLATGTLDGPSRAAVIQADGQLTKAADYLPQIIAYHDGAPVRFSDVGKVIDSVENRWLSGLYNGKPGVTLGINRQPGANTIAVVDAVKNRLTSIRAQLPPSIALGITLDRSQSIRASVHDVQTTLIIAAVLVVAVIFLFLRTVSATFIPSIALPITVIGTFAGMAALRLQPRQSVADGAHAVRRLRRGRCDRDAGKHHAPCRGRGKIRTRPRSPARFLSASPFFP